MTQALAIPSDEGANESDLVRRVRRGDRGAEYALYQLHAPRVHRLIYRLCGDVEMTNDLTQDVFVRAFQKLDHFREEAAFGTWVHRIAVNLTLNAKRGEQRRARRFTTMDEVEGVAMERGNDPDLEAGLAAAIAQLTDGQRTVFVMHALEGYTHTEIGQILGISEGTSKGRLFFARTRLRELLARFAPEGSA